MSQNKAFTEIKCDQIAKRGSARLFNFI